MYPNRYITCSYAARMMCRASAPDAPAQFFKEVVRYYYIAGRLFNRDKVIKSHSVYPNSYITSSYAARMMCRASAPDAPAQFLKSLVRPGNVLLTNCGVSTADRFYLVKSDPRRKPDVRTPESMIKLMLGQMAGLCTPWVCAIS